MPCDEGCRTAVLGKTERTVGWEGNGCPVRSELVRHCIGGNPQSTDRLWLPPLNHSFTLDFVIRCQSQEEAEAALAEVEAWTVQHGLALNPDKTTVGNCTQAGQGFDFLGYRFEGGHRCVRRKSLQALKDKIRGLTGRTRSGSMRDIIAELNPILKGWFGYFKHARGSTFRALDGFVRRRLRAVLRKREKRPGFGRTQRDHYRWPNAFFAVHGLFTFHEAHVLASQSR